MKKLYYILLLSVISCFTSCKKEEALPGMPIMDIKTNITDAYFGDSLSFTINASDTEVPLSTLKAQLYYGDLMVSETVIRTKESGKDYNGKIFIPFLKEIPDGNATLKFILQNINFTISEMEHKLKCSRPDYDNILLITEDGAEYVMNKTEKNIYSVTGNFPNKVNAYIKAPKYGENGNDIYFGSENGEIKEGTTSFISFSSVSEGSYTITFNTYNYEASPFIHMFINDNELKENEPGMYQIDLSLSQGQPITFTGIPNYENWWIDSDYFSKGENENLTFAPLSGDYRIIADTKNQYFKVEKLANDTPAVLNQDGSGAIWVIGEKVGKPSFNNNEIGWDTNKALCMSSVENGIYQITLTAGVQVNAETINFKFFHQKGWGGEFTGDKITSESDIVIIPKEDGNLAIAEGKKLEVNNTYKFTVDVRNGIDKAILKVEKISQ